jgi:hypothetical protein
MERAGMQKAAKLLHYEERGNFWLAEGNEAQERGNHDKAEKCFRIGQFWLDRYNKLAGNS